MDNSEAWLAATIRQGTVFDRPDGFHRIVNPPKQRDYLERLPDSQQAMLFDWLQRGLIQTVHVPALPDNLVIFTPPDNNERESHVDPG